MAANPEPANLALEIRAIEFIIDHDGANEVECERLRSPESRIEKNLRRCMFRRTTERRVLTDTQQPQDGISESFLCSESPFAHFPKPVPPVQPSMSHEVGSRSCYRRHNTPSRMEEKVLYSRPQTERVMRSSSTCPTRKQTGGPQGGSGETRKPKR